MFLCRRLLTVNVLALAVLSACSGEPAQEDQPQWMDARTALNALNTGELSSQALVTYYLNNIARDNRQGHELAAIIDVNAQALAQAQALDAERAAGTVRSALHGLPVVLKANIATADDMPTTAGALALQGHLTNRDAALVAQLRDAGAIILAKANLSEWANFRGEDSISGWSALGGQTLNPHLLTHTPCGSSAGSAVAVAADMTLLAIGTETDGSIMCPAAINGIVGIKPTRGSVSGEGIIPIASAQDIAGPMARNVFDAALLLDGILTPEARSRFQQPLSYSVDQVPDLQKVVLVRAYDARESAFAPVFDQLTDMFESRGVEVVQLADWQAPREMGAAEFEVLIYEFRRDLEQWLQDYDVAEDVNTFAELVAFNNTRGEAALGPFGQEYLEQAAAVDLVADQASYQQALASSRQLAEAMLNEYLQVQGADAIILPSYSKAWPIDPDSGDGFGFGTSGPAAISGYPSITLPAAFNGILPLGISVVGLPWSEPTLLSLAAELERELDAYQAPQFATAAP
ncbi:amidase family protein [Pseudohongiella sp.]|uniref:Amidase domain-containing protein n=1 Tax=marine sediment metagenome TaxID=412755 RepID=A0A0F9V560_9ZZZZ|nr:amidase family protein [Pseudohongiella sp.]HDZ08902.1 amidase [Pseudohongiella sp.]HEA64020.1 amidase [Pseudohongiella sp.]